MDVVKEISKFIAKKDVDKLDYEFGLNTLKTRMIRNNPDPETEIAWRGRNNKELIKIDEMLDGFKCNELTKKQVFEILRCQFVGIDGYGSVNNLD